MKKLTIDIFKMRKAYAKWLKDKGLQHSTSNFDTFAFDYHLARNRFSTMLRDQTDLIIQVKA